MTLFKSPFAHLSHKSKPVVATNMSLDSWCQQSITQSTRFVQKVELCTALAAGDDAWGTPLGEDHHHTLLRISLVPTRSDPGASADTLLIERVLSTGGAFHSVAPVAETFPTSGTLFHPDVHDRVCVTVNGPSTALAHDLQVERTLTFGDRALTLGQFAQILGFVSQMTKLICDGGDCRFQSRSFAFTCLAALSPTFPPRKTGEGVATRVGCESEMDDSVFELGSEAYLVQVPWLVRDPESLQALKLIGALKEPVESVKASLYH
ncbi:hypothetical protein OG21DRAFT_1481932 [Imleria badia]|nr:hypothetical protein OG21DRAFT_1481932 [Imleria badia]